MKQIMFSRVFPKGHPKAGQPTRFVEKIWSALADMGRTDDQKGDFGDYDADWQSYYSGIPKWHTIRAGRRWKVGDWFVPKIWSGNPYRSKTISVAQPIEVKKEWPILMTPMGSIYIDGRRFEQVEALAANDGLTYDDFNEWFPANRRFDGQIICWNEKIEYNPLTHPTSIMQTKK